MLLFFGNWVNVTFFWYWFIIHSNSSTSPSLHVTVTKTFWSYMTFGYAQHLKIAACLVIHDILIFSTSENCSIFAMFRLVCKLPEDHRLKSSKSMVSAVGAHMCGVSYNLKSFTQIHEAVVLLEEQILFSEATVSKTFLESSFLLIRGQTSIYPHTATSKLCFLDDIVAKTLLLLILCKSYLWKNDCFFCRINLTTNILLLVDHRANFLINKQFFSRYTNYVLLFEVIICCVKL